ncbi:MAG: HAMP domain-containing protein [Acidobacteria bacterium]|nr:HAMP domain-containing protein [Acidobacteriota bacterium]
MIASLALLVILQSTNLWKSFTIDTSADLLALYALSSLNFIAFVIFAFIFLRSLIRLIHERRTFQLGAKIKTRLLIYFVAISLLPIIAMAAFSYLFMNRALERWFSQIPQNVIAQARGMQQSALEEHTATLDASARMLASVLENREITDATLATVGKAGGLAHVEVLSGDNKTLAVNERVIPPDQRGDLDEVLGMIHSGRTDAPSFTDRKGYDAAIASMSGGRKLVIIPDPINEKNVGQVVENSVAELNRLSDQQLTIRRVALLTLGVLTFLLLFASSWIAFYIARRLTDPVKALAEGAGEVASGNLGYQVDVFAEDELGILVAAFNEMSARLDANAAELRERRRYIETVLETLPTGIISFDEAYEITTINSAAVAILSGGASDRAGGKIEDLIPGDNGESIMRMLSRARRVGHASDQIVVHGVEGNGTPEKELTAALTAARLPGDSGVVLVIEDLSQLIAAQRASAWQEVARRMAHEIKNPLTPIQLSAERIQKRFDRTGHVATGIGKRIDDKGPISDVVHESTATILREVSSLKSMVDEFSRFARLPEAQLRPEQISEIIQQALVGVEGRFPMIEFVAQTSRDLPQVNADAEQLKRVLVNLLDNAAEAFDDGETSRRVNVSARYDQARDLVVTEVSDNGRGLDPASLQKLFQPYFSTKGRGTGLGLAIVNRIIADHKGRIYAAQNQPRGAKFIIELPAFG